MSSLKSQIILLFILFAISCIASASDSIKVYTPRIEGTIRGKYEYFTELEQNRFQVRNARFSIQGKVARITSYKAEIDLSDEGKTKMLDAFVKFQPQKWWSFTIGQQKVPFSTDNLRSPHNFYFANRSFIGKQLINLRDVGASLNFTNQKYIPFNFTFGLFNGLGLYSQDKPLDLNQMSYAGRVIFMPTNSIQFQINALTINPDVIRINFYNIGVIYEVRNLTFEAEFLHKTYNSEILLDFIKTDSWLLQAIYDIPTPRLKNIRKISPLIRYDDMTRNKRYDVQNSSSINIKTDEARKRFTGGITFSLAKPFVNDIRLNYERYFWTDGKATDSKIVAEFVVHF